MLDSNSGQTPAVGIPDTAKAEDQRTNYIVIDFKETDVLSRLVQSLDAPVEEAVTGTSPLSEVTPFWLSSVVPKRPQQGRNSRPP